MFKSGITLLKRRKQARHEQARQMRLHTGLTDVVPGHNTTTEWTAEVQAWEKDRRNLPSPYGRVVKHEYLMNRTQAVTHFCFR